MHRMTTIALASLLVIATLGTAAAGMQLSDWSAATNVAAIAGTSPDLNTAALEGCPIESPNGLELYFASNRDGGEGLLDIWVSKRPSRDAPWGAPENLGPPINSEYNDFCPTPARGNRFFFVSDRPSICGDEDGRGADIYVSRRHPVRGFGPPVNVGCEVNSAWGEASPAYVEDGAGGAELYFSSSRPSPYGGSNLYVSTLQADGTFGPAQLVEGVNTNAFDARPNLRRDGLEMVFDSDRPGGHGGADIWVTTRASRDHPWTEPVNLGPGINSPDNEVRPSLSWDGTRLYLGSNRPGGEGSSDIYVAERSRITGRTR